MANLNIIVTADQGKKKESLRLTSFAIGESIVRSELATLNKEARQAKIREFAKRFLTPEQQEMEFICTVVAEEQSTPEVAPTVEAATPTEPEIAHCE